MYANNDETIKRFVQDGKIDELLEYLNRNPDAKTNGINFQDFLGMTPLMYAASLDVIEPMKILLEHGADWRLKNLLRKTAYDCATRKGKKALNSYGIVLESGVLEVTPTEDIISTLFLEGTTEDLTSFLKFLRSQQRQQELNVKNEFGDTILHTLAPFTVGNDKLAAIRTIIKYGADPAITNAQNKSFYDLIHPNAAAKINAPDESGENIERPQPPAKKSKKQVLIPNERVKELVQKNLSGDIDRYLNTNPDAETNGINFQDFLGMTPLMYAASLDFIEAMKVLLEHGADWRLKNMLQRTVYDLASTQGKKVFKSYGIVRVSKDSEDPYLTISPTEDTVSKLFREGTTEDLTSFLKFLRSQQRQQELNVKNEFGDTILHTLAPLIFGEDKLAAMKIIIEYGADPVIKNAQNKNFCELLPPEVQISMIALISEISDTPPETLRMLRSSVDDEAGKINAPAAIPCENSLDPESILDSSKKSLRKSFSDESEENIAQPQLPGSTVEEPQKPVTLDSSPAKFSARSLPASSAAFFGSGKKVENPNVAENANAHEILYNDEAPADYYCPVSLELMNDPVLIIETEQTCDKKSADDWFNAGNKTCPVTGTRLSDNYSCHYVRCLTLRTVIEAWKQEHKVDEPAPPGAKSCSR